jgi:hypothetical protein
MSATLSPSKPTLAAIWRKGLTAVVVAVLMNVVLYFVGSPLGAFPSDVVTPAGTPITVALVVIMSVLPLLIGTLGYTILNWLTTTPNRWFTILAIIVLIVMAYTPFTLPGAPVIMNLFLQVMHLVAGGSLIYCLTRT